MSDINDENLPSIEDYSDSSDDLPSVSDFLTEEELPSIEDYIKEESGGLVEEDKITIAVQVNGKMRGTIEVASDAETKIYNYIKAG